MNSSTSAPMPDEPYRTTQTGSRADDELKRLAAEGKRKADVTTERQEAEGAVAASKSRDTVIRAALGAYYGSPTRQAAGFAFVVIVFCIVGGIASSLAGREAPAALAGIGFVSFLAAIVLLIVQHKATHARVAAERERLKSLPFELRGYFDLLATDDHVEVHVLVDLEFEGAPPDASLVQGAAGPGLHIRGGALPNTFVDFHGDDSSVTMHVVS